MVGTLFEEVYTIRHNADACELCDGLNRHVTKLDCTGCTVVVLILFDILLSCSGNVMFYQEGDPYNRTRILPFSIDNPRYKSL